MRNFIAAAFLLICALGNAQTNVQVTPQSTWTYSTELSTQELYRYERLLYMSKEDWELFRHDPRYDDQRVREIYREHKGKLPTSSASGLRMPSETNCQGWIEPDNTYTATDPANWPNCGGGGPGVDCWLGPLTLPFSFCFFGQNFNQVCLTSKGTIVFGAQGYFDWTPSEFPNPVNNADPQYDHLCGFWADFDFRETGIMYYKIDPTALYVNYVDVGYWANNGEKTNSFQMILTANNAGILPNNNNVQFVYQDMQWAHGDVGGTQGFSGPTPATVGADRVTGSSHVQFGRFNLANGIYNGPYGQATNQQDGINWLDNRILNFNTCLSSANVPPLATTAPPCDTIYMCLGETFNFDLEFLSPEANQITTITVNQIGSGYTGTPMAANVAQLNGLFTASAANVGTNLVSITATDNGSPAASTTLTYVFIVLDEELPPLTVTGITTICAGGQTTLTASPGFDAYQWSSGCFSQSCEITAGGSINVTGFLGQCSATTSVFVDASNYFIPDLASQNEPITICPGETTEICLANPEYVAYTWSVYPGLSGNFEPGTPLDQPCVQVNSGGNYLITVENANGCLGQNIQVVNEVQSYVDPINEENNGAYCNGLQPITFSGAYSNPQDGNLLVYCISTTSFGWQGSYLLITVTHPDGTSDEYVLTGTNTVSIGNVPISVFDQITVNYVSSGVGDANNTVWLFNCSTNGQITLPVQDPTTPETEVLQTGIIWQGQSACTALPLTGTWQVSGPAGWNLTSTNEYNTTFTPALPGSYTLCFDDPSCATDNCYEVSFASPPSIALDISAPQLLCGNDVVNTCANVLDFGGTGVITWSGNNVTANDATNCAVAGPYSGYTNTVVSVSITNGCGTSSDSFTVEHQPDVPTPNLSDETVCDGASVLLDPIPTAQDNSNLQYTWTPGGSSGSTLNVTQSGTYSVVVSNDCDTSQPETATINITGPANITSVLPATVNLCDENDYTLGITVPAGYSISWNNGATTPSITVNESGNYCYEVTDNNNCETLVTDCSNITFGATPQAGSGGSEAITLCPGECEAVSIEQNNGASYSWTSNCPGLTLAQNSNVIDICADNIPSSCLNNIVEIQGTVSNGCGSASVNYSVVANLCFITVPNVITPNQDGMNNTFFIAGLEKYNNVKLRIYDRWGSEVYGSDNYRNNWAPGDDVTDGTYFYLLELPFGSITKYNGSLTIVR